MIFEYILAVCTILGGIIGLLELWKLIQGRRGRFGWRSIVSGTKQIIKKIQKENYRPDIIVGLGRGGFILAGMLSGNLGIVPLGGLDRKYIWDGKHRKTIVHDSGQICVTGKKVLLVVAEPYTGETLRKGYEYLKGRCAREIRTAALFKAETCTFVPDFHAYEVKRVTWLPWRLSDLYARDSKDPEHYARYLEEEVCRPEEKYSSNQEGT